MLCFLAHNVAPSGQSSQSSTNRRFQSQYAIDRQLSSSCTMTEVEYEPWWTLALQSNHLITFVAVTNRRDCCAKDLDGAEIHIGNNVNWKENPRYIDDIHYMYMSKLEGGLRYIHDTYYLHVNKLEGGLRYINNTCYLHMSNLEGAFGYIDDIHYLYMNNTNH